MPMHDWRPAGAGLLHHFHQDWTISLARALNRTLPKGYSALAEQFDAKTAPDVLTAERRDRPPLTVGGAVMLEEPRVRHSFQLEMERYADRANRIVIRHRLGDVVAALEIVSPGNKSSRRRFRKFLDKSVRFLERGVHLLVVDPFPPGPRDPRGIHSAIWTELGGEPLAPPAEQPLTLACYVAGHEFRAYVEHVGFGQPLPDMPLYLNPETYVNVPLEAAYADAWSASPEDFRAAVEGQPSAD